MRGMESAYLISRVYASYLEHLISGDPHHGKRKMGGGAIHAHTGVNIGMPIRE